MKKLLFKYLGFLIFLLFTYITHKYLLNTQNAENQIAYINFTYLFNAISSTIILGALFIIYKIDQDFLGFLLMLLGIIKIFFFVVLLKRYGFSLERKLFLNAFLPYAIGQIAEIWIITQLLKTNNSK